VFVRQAIARKLTPVVDVEPDSDIDPAHGYHEDVEIDDHDEEAEEA
jgi:hypothetical protein